jgi:hypothetical protein
MSDNTKAEKLLPLFRHGDKYVLPSFDPDCLWPTLLAEWVALLNLPEPERSAARLAEYTALFNSLADEVLIIPVVACHD